jgi:hypothetical protein
MKNSHPTEVGFSAASSYVVGIAVLGKSVSLVLSVSGSRNESARSGRLRLERKLESKKKRLKQTHRLDGSPFKQYPSTLSESSSGTGVAIE